MHRAALLAALILFGAALAGCLGGSDDGGEPVQKQRADVTTETGGIEGLVTDTAIQPVAGANVTLAETNITVRTADDGSYAFSRLEPGTYTVVVRDPGFVSASEEARVAAGSVATLDFLLAHLVSDEAYTQALEVRGFIECGLGWRTPLPEPVPILVRNSALAACAVPNSVLETNATNDRFIHILELEAPLNTLVYEMAWESTSPGGGGTWLWSILDVEPVFNSNGSRIISKKGQSPLHVVVNNTQWDELAQNLTDRCEEGNDAWCNIDPREKGWPFMLRVFAFSDCLNDVASACVVFQQSFDHILTAFYNAPAPEGYSALSTS